MSRSPEPPHNVEAEKATLGSILLNREAIVAVAPWLLAEYFHFDRHAQIYEAMLACYNARIPPDTRTVSEELRRRDRLDAVGGVPYLSDLVDTVPTSYHVEYYARIVERTAQLRKLIAAGGKIAALGYDEQEDLESTFDRAEQTLFAVRQQRGAGDAVSLEVSANAYYERIKMRQDGQAADWGRPTQFTDLDKMTGGLQNSDLIILAARPSAGKTALALNIAKNAASAGARVGYFSLEMSRDQLFQRLLAIETRVPTNRLRTADLATDELPTVMEALGRLADLPITIEDTPSLTVMELRSRARRMQARTGLDLLIVDYLQLMQARRNDNRVQEVSEISRGLKLLARELNVPVIALSQLSRAIEGRPGHLPMLSDLRDSGSLEQDADIVLFIHREEMHDRETDKKGIAELYIAKHRNGPVGVVPLHFDSNATRFTNLSYRSDVAR
jgi:replicative DNA helicase